MRPLTVGRAAIAILVLVFPWLMISCGGPSTSASGTPVAPANGSLTVRAREWGFELSSIVLRRGEQVTVDFTNQGSILHDLKITGLAAAGVASQGSGLAAGKGELFVAANKGGTGTLVFTPTESGQFDFYCTIPRHRDLGMKGKLIVE